VFSVSGLLLARAESGGVNILSGVLIVKTSMSLFIIILHFRHFRHYFGIEALGGEEIFVIGNENELKRLVEQKIAIKTRNTDRKSIRL